MADDKKPSPEEIQAAFRQVEANEARSEQLDLPIRLVCGNCGKEGRFASWEAAFEADWDTVERFGYNACDECPGVSVYFPMMYAQEARGLSDQVKRAELLAKAADATLAYDPARRSLKARERPAPEGAEPYGADPGLEVGGTTHDPAPARPTDPSDFFPFAPDVQEGDLTLRAWQPANDEARRVMVLQVFRGDELLVERESPMLHPNLFGVDVSDVAAFEAMTDAVLKEMADR